jgi:DNA-binding CsgD family transcriptional regulator/tetratricopeptide (TPR) repeat protein
LQESDERDAIQDAHCQYYLRFLHERELDIQGRRQIDALEEITLDFENIRSAWSWAVEQMNYDGIRIAVETLCSYLHIRSRWIPDSSIVTQAQNRFAPRDGEKPHPVWAMIIARNYLNNDDPVLALEQALVVAREQNDKGEIGLYLFLMGTAYAYQYNPIESSRYHLAAIPYFEELRDYYHLALAYGLVGTNYRLIGDYESSTEYNEKSLNLRRMIGDIDGQAFATAELSNTMFIIGNLEEAERYRREAILLAQQTGRGGHIAWQQWELAIYHSFGVNGDLREARHSVEDAQNALAGLPKIYKGRGNIVFSHSLIASMDEDYDTARKYGEEALRFNENDAWAPLYRWGLLTAACGQEDYDTVREHTYDLLSRFWELRVVPLLLLGVSFSAILAAYQDKNPQRATELLALASTHRSSMSGWLRVWRLIERLQHQLENELGVDAYEAAWERGKGLEWEYVVARLIAEYENKMSLNVGQLEIPPYITEANAKLIEPLSERELEVLIKVSEGHSNQEIAEQLFVGVSTVKKHITHIYSKLGVESRTQALLWAQELKMN